MIVPPAGHSVVLEVLHDGHPGGTKMKKLARSIVWWPGIDKYLENSVRQVPWHKNYQHMYHSTHGNGLVVLRPDYMSTMQDHSWRRCFSY